ncbi:MAG: hypothetical protein OEW35_15685 [Gammaproteobacteria bacterium]|nr:hypothetical protein [Gammaproteobacteria bacterium]MDH4256299.1 hypothetical protein [Gammaproteobacteria bacterium]MDH5311621.1 hypothetical protein [Gammaproteobacteria bacterium]
MDRHRKWIGVALVVGGLLMFTRMAPVLVVLPEDMAFPPATTQEMLRLAVIAGARWQLSHVMGLFAVLLFGIAYGWHVIFLVRAGWRWVGPGLAVTSLLAFTLFGIALLIDGFAVPAMIDDHLAAGGARTATLEQVEEMHLLALRFFAPGIFLLFLTIGLFSAPMLHREIHSRWLGVTGQTIAVVAVMAYLTGLTGPHWNEMQIAGTLMLAAFAWHLLVGARALIAKPIAAVPQPR